MGELVYDGTNLSPNAAIKGNIVVTLDVFIGLSEAIISAAKSFNISRSQLTFSYPIGSAELLKFVGIEIKNGQITGALELQEGKDIAAIRSAIDSGVREIKAVWDSISGAFDDAYNLIEGSVEYWQEHGVIGTLSDFASAVNDVVDQQLEGTVVGDAKDFWEEKGIVGGLEEFGNEVGDLWDSLWD